MRRVAGCIVAAIIRITYIRHPTSEGCAASPVIGQTTAAVCFTNVPLQSENLDARIHVLPNARLPAQRASRANTVTHFARVHV